MDRVDLWRGCFIWNHVSYVFNLPLYWFASLSFSLSLPFPSPPSLSLFLCPSLPLPPPGPQLVSVLREVRYLEALQTEVIPDTAALLYTTRGQLWQYLANLELTVGSYNKVGGDKRTSPRGN